MMTEKIKWAIWGTGHISNRFTASLAYEEQAEVCCVVSRTQQSADAFAKEHGIAGAYDNAEKMLAEGGADVVYIGTPNRMHFEEVMACIRHKKHVLCEKPMAINSGEMRQLQQAAKEAGVFLMEGMWTLCFPAIQKAKSWIAEGKIGRPLHVDVNFSARSMQGGWRMGAEQAGGALMDVGIYCLTIIDLAFGLLPKETKSMAQLNNGVDISNNVILKYSKDQFAAFSSALVSTNDHRAIIQGEKGYIEINPKFFSPKEVNLYLYTDDANVSNCVDSFTDEYPGYGFQYEAAHVGACIQKGMLESDIMTHEKSMQLITLMDQLRIEWGMKID